MTKLEHTIEWTGMISEDLLMNDFLKNILVFLKNQIVSYVTVSAFPVQTLNGWRLKGPFSDKHHDMRGPRF